MDYIIKHMTPFHCKRGSLSCASCQRLSEAGPKWCVLQLFIGGSDPPVARPVVDLEGGGMAEFEFVGCFDTRLEAEQKLVQLTSSK